MEETVTLCITCREEIRLNATKCRYCGSYQKKWKLMMVFGGPVLGLLVALISIVITGAPLAVKAIKSLAPKKVDISVVVANPDESSFQILAVNQGNATGVLLSPATLSMKVNGAETTGSVRIIGTNNIPSALALKPDEIKIFKITHNDNPSSPFRNAYKKGEGSDCTFNYEITKLNNQRETRSEKFECPP